ncbi:VanZ family protein [Salinarimonas soli]|uniref:VanZ family protein n=1 Tax=Salinarimonas soli TaxID=1638099 RepID=A0A5B2V9D2_9HYPH|nr:VanZ family protein [Salinarimonas soli]KAA2235185.1 VanZ family protein [Salinarimonas soli]
MLTLIIRWAAWTVLAATIVASLAPIEFRPSLDTAENLERTVAFAVLGGVFWLAYPERRGLVLVLVVSAAGLLEMLQAFAPSRHGHVDEAFVKAAAVALGCAGAEVAKKIGGDRR